MTLLIGFLIGCAFGAILFLGGATSYRRILGTLLLKDMWIIKLMMTAIGVGTLGIYLLDMGARQHVHQARLRLGCYRRRRDLRHRLGPGRLLPRYLRRRQREGKKDAIFTLLGRPGRCAAVFPPIPGPR
jgi:hypothetical protein